MGKGALRSPEFSLNARIPTLPNCVQEGDFNLANTALKNCTTSSTSEVRKLLRGRTDLESVWMHSICEMRSNSKLGTGTAGNDCSTLRHSSVRQTT